ncbi:MAG: hypothetical protein IJZ85_02645 [Lachnospiraceae bacterium]|nr:hypothetical protein [Lachnospiraceae bacterium]
MSKVIGIVSEGPTDYLVLKSVIDKITGEENRYLPLQPEADMMGRYGNGWKGVWKWCKETVPLDVIMDSIQPRIDVIVIQMDGDVIRKEKEVHCLCESTTCAEKGKEFPLYCEQAAARMCPIEIPCNSHSDEIEDIINHGKHVLDETINMPDKSRIIVTIPCDSTDAWIVAAYDDFENIEKIEDPWRSIIAKGKYYHDVRVRGDKKSINTYNVFAEHLVDNWDLVTDKCYSAKLLEQEITKVFI